MARLTAIPERNWVNIQWLARLRWAEIAGQAGTVLVGQFLLDGALSFVWTLLSLLPLSVALHDRPSVAGWSFDEALVVVGWFTQDPAVAPIATLGLRIVSGGFPFYAAGYVLTQSFNGAGDTLTPTLINVGCFWLFELPLSYALGHTFGYGPTGIFLAMALAFSLMSVVSAWLFRRGTWKSQRV